MWHCHILVVCFGAYHYTAIPCFQICKREVITVHLSCCCHIHMTLDHFCFWHIHNRKVQLFPGSAFHDALKLGQSPTSYVLPCLKIPIYTSSDGSITSVCWENKEKQCRCTVHQRTVQMSHCNGFELRFFWGLKQTAKTSLFMWDLGTWVHVWLSLFPQVPRALK